MLFVTWVFSQGFALRDGEKVSMEKTHSTVNNPADCLNAMNIKEEASVSTLLVTLGLLNLIPLMQLSTLLYHTATFQQSEFFPDGEDQKQHVELACKLAQRVHYLCGGRTCKKL